MEVTSEIPLELVVGRRVKTVNVWEMKVLHYKVKQVLVQGPLSQADPLPDEPVCFYTRCPLNVFGLECEEMRFCPGQEPDCFLIECGEPQSSLVIQVGLCQHAVNPDQHVPVPERRHKVVRTMWPAVQED